MSLRFGNVNLFVADVEAALRFYARLLGLEHDAERSHPPGFALLRSGEMTITLQGPDTPGWVSGRAESMELGFSVDDVAATRERLEAAGVRVSPLQEMGWGSGFDATDPDGFRLTFFRMRG